MRAPRTLLLLVTFVVAGAQPGLAAFTESPELHLQVEKGVLPPLDQRLPQAPLVISPVEKPGEYGGTWHMVLVGYEHNSMLLRTLAYEQLVRWDPNWSRVVPNIASSWTINADATVYRFQLRRGMRWSDGQPFSAQDIVAWVDDVARDPELTPVPPAWLVVDGRLPECSAPDDFTVEFRFATPNVLFLEQLASIHANEMTHYPAHHFRKVHRTHGPEGAATLMQKTGLPWAVAFRTVYSPWNWHHVDVPTIDAWMITNPYVPGTTAVTAVRNPYYWKIDPLGRQLPYLDRVQFAVVANDTEALQQALDGHVDYQRNDFASVNASAGPAIRAAEKAGLFRFVRVIPSRSNPLAICLNITHADPVMRTVLGNKNVRIALSEAINRKQIIDQLYDGEATPWQVAPRPISPFYNRRLGEQYTEHNPAEASRLLEAAGLRAPNAGEIRRLPDGRPFQVTLLVLAPGSATWRAILDQVKKDWLAVGVAMDWVILPQDAFFGRIMQNQHDGAVLKGAGGYAAILEPEFFVPACFGNIDQSFYAIPWAHWFIGPKTNLAEKPPESVERQMAIFRRVMTEPDRESRHALMAQVVEMAADEFYAMGICLEPDRFAIRTPGFRNVPASHFDSWLYPDPGPLNPCQFFQETLRRP